MSEIPEDLQEQLDLIQAKLNALLATTGSMDEFELLHKEDELNSRREVQHENSSNTDSTRRQ